MRLRWNTCLPVAFMIIYRLRWLTETFAELSHGFTSYRRQHPRKMMSGLGKFRLSLFSLLASACMILPLHVPGERVAPTLAPVFRARSQHITIVTYRESRMDGHAVFCCGTTAVPFTPLPLRPKCLPGCLVCVALLLLLSLGPFSSSASAATTAVATTSLHAPTAHKLPWFPPRPPIPFSPSPYP